LPNGQQYTFTYGPWNNLVQAVSADGSVDTYHYGATTGTLLAFPDDDFAPPYTAPSTPGGLLRLESQTAYPQGLSGPGYTTKIDHFQSSNLIRVTHPDGSVTETQFFGDATEYNHPGQTTSGRVLKEERCSGPCNGSNLVEGTYYADPSGATYLTWDSASLVSGKGPIPGWNFLDVRPTKIRHKKCDYGGCLTWWTTFTYDAASGIPTDNNAAARNRTLGNVTKEAISGDCGGAPCGTPIVQTVKSFVASPAGANLINREASVQVLDGSGGFGTRTDYAYDEYALAASGAAHLNASYVVGGARANPTTTMHYTSPTASVQTHTHYFDNGAVYQTIDAKGVVASTVSAFDFGDCSGSHLTRAMTTKNALGQAATAVADCYSGNTLSTRDANGDLSCMQYDLLGRLVETAAPGDTLTAPPACAGAGNPGVCYVRDPQCPTAGSSIGNGGAGPTTWTSYFPFGVGGVTYNQARTVTATRDGTSNGLLHTTFVDGEDRPIQTCSEVDPTTNGGSGATCTITKYDNMGRVSESYVPFYVSGIPTSVANGGLQYTQKTYDSLGRVTSTQLMKSGVGVLPPTKTQYTVHVPDSGQFPNGGFGIFVTDANGWWVEDDRDVVGRVFYHWTQTGPQSGGFVKDTMQYDAASRLTAIIDPSGNVTSYSYDGLGRKTKAVDPDLGTRTYLYDNNGNLTQQTDARGAVIHLSYDPLNRLTLRDLPYLKNGATWVNGTPGEEDEITYYDSLASLPATCYSCDDHCASTTDTCAAATLSCTHTGTACASPNQ
jgi:YD repeat-containing protein